MKLKTRYISLLMALMASLAWLVGNPLGQKGDAELHLPVATEVFVPTQVPHNGVDNKDTALLRRVQRTQTERYSDLQRKSPIDLRTPSNVKTEVVYDPANNVYLFRTLIGGQVWETPYVMSAGEYVQYRKQNDMATYFRRKNAEAQERAEKAQEEFSLKDIRVGLGPAERFLGPGGIRIKTQGSLEIASGLKRTAVDNPSLSESSRAKTIFDFEEKIQLRTQASVGDKVNFNLNYDTEATFDFDSKKIKLAYDGKEDEILRHLEAGNVSMTTTNSLISGGAALFGIKTDLQFGKLKVSAIAAQQESQSRTVSSQGGVQTTAFEIASDQYDANQHFFLNEYFRAIYDDAVSSLPYVQSGVTINRIEVWITNKRANYDQARNVVAFADLGEHQHLHNTSQWSATGGVQVPHNGANNLYANVRSNYPDFRDISKVTSVFAGVLTAGQDYEKVESARLLSPSEYIVNNKLGYISLRTKLQSDEVLAVAYEYKLNGETYQVGEFAADVPSAVSSGSADAGALLLKLVKPTSLTPKSYLWNTMMKNVYSLGASQFQNTNFQLQIAYLNDTTGNYINYLTEGKIAGKQLLQVMGLDRLDSRQNVRTDGKFDYVDGYTVIPSIGRIVFPSVEPFGAYLRKQFDNNQIAEKYVYQELYDQTQTDARQVTEKNKFRLVGAYQGSSSAIISLNATNVARGSVVVTAGGITLSEGTDYSVDYVSGLVTILNQSIIDAGTAVSVKLEDQSVFSMQRKTMLGLNVSYDFSKKLNVGATVMNLSEMPLTTKAAYGSEAINNTLWGLNANYNSKSDWLTALVNKLPNVNATQPSQVTFSGEFAHLIAGHNRNKNGNYSYLDDFEASQNAIDVMNPSSWTLASVPYDASSSALFPESALSNNVDYGKNRALLSWFTVARLFTQRNSAATPLHIKNDKNQLSNHFVRQINETEIFPNRAVATTEVSTISALNLSFYPTERGPYNLDADGIDSEGLLTNPAKRWGGITRRLETTDFESSNIGYIQFWMLDPFVYKQSAGGDLYFNLGNVSEDVLKDGKKFFENGLPINGDATAVENTVWGKVPARQSSVIAFDDSNGAESRKRQDVGMDGLTSDEEKAFSSYSSYVNQYRSKLNANAITRLEADPFSPLNDPAGDNYHFFRGSDYDQQEKSILDRYKYYNGTEGNSLTDNASGERYSTAAKNTPDIEDINADNTLSETEAYYQYKVELRPDKMQVGENHIVDARKVTVQLPNGNKEEVTWYQFKIPIREYQKAVGNLDGFNSIRFMRMFMTNFSETTHLRFATLELVRNEWRPYDKSLLPTNASPSGSFVVSAVNIEENAERTPVNYILPPGVTRETDAAQSQVMQQNEQAMSLKVSNLSAGDARAAYKTMNVDLRRYKRLQMFTHLEELINGSSLAKGDLSVFVRLGTDYRNNYYEYEIPLTVTPHGIYSNFSSTDRERVWPSENMFDFPLELLKNVKVSRNKAKEAGKAGVSYTSQYYEYDPEKPGNRVSVMGNPSLGEVKMLMVGIRNKSASTLSGEVWVNELRLDDFSSKGGWAARGSLNIALSDVGTVNLTGRKETDGFGSLDQNLQQRRDNTLENLAITTNFDIGRLFPKKLQLSIPFYYTYAKEVVTPRYNFYDTDITMAEALRVFGSQAQRDSLLELNRSLSTTKGIVFNNIRFNIRSKNPMPYDPANFSVSYSHNETKHITPAMAYDSQQNMKFNVTYHYSPVQKSWSPFKNTNSKRGVMQQLKQWSFNYVPNSVSVTSTIQRNYQETKLRQLNDAYAGMDKADLLSWSEDFIWNRDFSLNWDFTKNLKMDFQSGTRAEIETPYLQVNKTENPDDYKTWKDATWRSIVGWGKPLHYSQSFKLNYSVPFQYLPATNWITATAGYESTYSWTRGNLLKTTADDIDLGNVVANTSSVSVNSRLNMVTLYNKWDFLKKVNQKFDAARRNSTAKSSRTKVANDNTVNKKLKYETTITLQPDTTTQVRHGLNSTAVKVTAKRAGKTFVVKFTRLDNNTIRILTKDTVQVQVRVTKPTPAEDKSWYKLAEYAARGLMSLRNVSVNYTVQSGSTISGFGTDIGDAFGQSSTDFGLSPGLKYAFGAETSLDFVERSRNSGWLVMGQNDISPALLTRTERMDIRAQIEPVQGLKIDLEAQRSLTKNTQVEYMHEGMPKTFSGSYSITTISLGTALRSVGAKNGYHSEAFANFLQNRAVIANRYNDAYRGLSSGVTLGTADINSSDVLIPAFLAAYSGKSASKVALSSFPSLASLLPNWRATYDGLSHLSFLRNKMKSLRLSHGYSSQYQVGAYTSYAGWSELSAEQGYVLSVLTGSYLPSSPYDISSVSITERFNPLLGVDATFNNNLTFTAKYNNSRSVTLNTTSYQIVEALSNELVVGMSHKIPNFNKVLGIGLSSKGFSSDLDVRADFSHKTIYALLRKIEDGYSQATSGTTMSSLKLSAAYALSRQLTLGAYLDRILNEPLVSATSFKTTTTNFGLSLKFNLTQ